MLARRRSNYLPERDMDSFRLGLVAEGGGMRGMISASALEALDGLGFGHCFDEVFGTSAGAINGAYLVADQISLGASIYYENLTGTKFINTRKWPDIMNIGHLFDSWITSGKKLDVRKILASPVHLFISATHVQTGETVFFHNKEINGDQLISALRASVSTPMFSSNMERMGVDLYNDGAVQAGIPVEKALARGCTHILCLLTRHRGYRKKRGPIMRTFEFLQLRKYSRHYRKCYKERTLWYNNALETIYSDSGHTPILAVAPESTDFLIRNNETGEDNLRKVRGESFQRITDIFG